VTISTSSSTDTPSARAGMMAAIGCAICIGLGVVPLFMGTVATFLKPVSNELGWSLSVFPQASLVVGLAGAAFGPFAGRLIDRHGVRRLLPLALTVCSVGLFAMSYVDSQLMLYVVSLLIGMGTAIAGPISYAKVVSGWYSKHRGLALGLVLSAAPALATAVTVPVSQALIASLGWHAAYRVLGVTAFVISVPTALLLVRESSAVVRSPEHAKSEADGLTGPQALRSRTFLLVMAVSCLPAAGLMAVSNHIISWMTGEGVEPEIASLSLSLYFLLGPLGSLVGGALVDRVPSPKVVTPFFFLPLIGMGLLFLGGTAGLLAGMALLGIAYSGISGFVPLLITRYFGLRASSEILGAAFAALTVFMGAGPVLVGYGHDVSGGYHLPMVIVTVVMLIAFIGSFFFPAFRYLHKPGPEEEPRAVEAQENAEI
jgi:MFS family permease